MRVEVEVVVSEAMKQKQALLILELRTPEGPHDAEMIWAMGVVVGAARLKNWVVVPVAVQRTPSVVVVVPVAIVIVSCAAVVDVVV